MLDIMCLMGLFPKEYEKTIVEDSPKGIQFAANNLQWGIVKGLIQQDEVGVKVLNSLYIGSFPSRYKKLLIPSFSFGKEEGIEGKNIGYTNLTGYKCLSRYFGLKKEIIKWAKKETQDEKVLLAYAMTDPFVDLIFYTKKHYPGIKTALVVPDLPEYMNAAKSNDKLYRGLKQYQINHFKKLTRKVDSFILLTDYMKEWFGRDVNYTVVEGICTASNEAEPEVGIKEKTILYAGILAEKYGISELVKSFSEIDAPEWKLEIYGRGESVETIKKQAEKDKRIRFCGMVSNDIVKKRQKQVSILVNPRNNNSAFTKYSFPSKTIEYMLSGTPMVGYALPGIPEEYRPYFYEVGDDGLKNTLEKVMRLSDEERENQGRKAREFVIKEKSPKSQGRKIVDFLRQ